MCCDGWLIGPEDSNESIGECPDCGHEAVVTTYVNGEQSFAATYGCNYSPLECQTCGSRPCDLSC